MIKTVSIVAGILLVAVPASGQVGWIGLYVDENYLEGCFDDVGTQLISIFVVHRSFGGATASQFMLVNGGGFACAYVDETVTMPVTAGSAYSGISIAYSQCLYGDILLLTVRQFCMGTSAECSYIEVVPDPAAPTGTIEVVDCEMTKLIGIGSTMWVNPTGYCSWECYHPTHETTWGRVKAQY